MFFLWITMGAPITQRRGNSGGGELHGAYLSEVSILDTSIKLETLSVK